MYSKRIKIFVITIACLLLAPLLRLAQMQLLPDSSIQEKIAELKHQRGFSRQFGTTRGRILDRKGRILAADKARFYLHIDYELSCFFDERIRQAKLLTAAQKQDPISAKSKALQEIRSRLEDLQLVIDKCVYFGLEREDIEDRINRINNKVWNLSAFLAQRRDGVTAAEFESKFPDPNDRLLHISRIDIAEMHNSFPLLELKTDDDIFTAQLEFMDIDGVRILPQAHRFYPYGPVAAQTIGWVGPEQHYRLFADDQLARYLKGEISGRRPGVEYVCEAVLRGRRGQEVYDIDRELVNRTETQFGRNVHLTVDIELQQRIENHLADCQLNPNCSAAASAVVIDVSTGDILALVSQPTFDLNRIRYDYREIENDPNKPLINRAINKLYPPGSAIKPIILIAGLEAGKITSDEIISCPAQKAPKGWPSCWVIRYGRGHDDQWPNNARNAIKGSCNVYFSHLADRIEPLVLQRWLFDFGYGRRALSAPKAITETKYERNFRQAQGQISNARPEGPILHFDDVPPLKKSERRWFGIGQGNLRATPLQVANAFAAIARGGSYQPARLFLANRAPGHEQRNLNISPQTLEVVYDGMGAVVNEPGGTAYRQFTDTGFSEQGIKLYGKTGSTERPANAWFAGFARDDTGRAIAVAVVVEGGHSGPKDAAPLAREIIRFCIEAGYIGGG